MSIYSTYYGSFHRTLPQMSSLKPPLRELPTMRLSDVHSLPRFLGENMFVLFTDGELACLNIQDQSVRWRTPIVADDVLQRHLTINSKYCLSGSSSRTLVFDVSTGKLLQRTELPLPALGLVLHRDTLTVSVYDGFVDGESLGQLIQLDLTSGEPNWKQKISYVDCLSLSEDGTSLFLNDEEDAMSCRAHSNGRIRWRCHLPDLHLDQHPSIYIDRNEATAVFDINGHRVEKWWDRETTPEELLGLNPGPPIVAGNRIFFGVDEHFVLCLQSGTGELLWAQLVPQRLPNVKYDPNTSTLYVLDEFHFSRHDAETGELLFFNAYDPRESGVDNVVDFEITEHALWGASNRSPHLYAFSKEDGELLWTTELPEGGALSGSGPLAYRNRLYHLDYDRNLWVYEQDH